jgi:single-strand DNA-binding protein
MLNRYEGIGRLAGDVEARQTASGMQIANFTVCCESGYGDKKETEFVRCAAFDKLAGICIQYLAKGSLVYVSGPMKTRKWDDKEGKTMYSTGVTINEMKMLGGKGERQAEERYSQSSTGEQVPF